LTGKVQFSDLSPSVKRNIVLDSKRFQDIEGSGWKLVKIWGHDIPSLKYGEILSSIFPSVQGEFKYDESQMPYIPVSAVAITKNERWNAKWFGSTGQVEIHKGSTMTPSEAGKLRRLLDSCGDDISVPDETVIKEFLTARDAGFPFTKLEDNEKKLLWESLSIGKTIPKEDGTYLWDGYGTGLPTSFHPHIFECRKKGRKSPIEFFNNDEDLKRGIKKVLCLYGKTTPSTIREICCNEDESSRCNNFPPRVAASIVRSLYPLNQEISILDPCAGFGGRMMGFSAARVKSYTCIDLSQKTYNGLNEEKSFIQKAGSLTSIEIIYGDCIEKMMDITTEFDLVMTSPPFVDKEEYVGVPFYTATQDWRDKFMVPFMKLCKEKLSPNGILALYLGKTVNSKSNKLPNIADDIAKSIGLIACPDIVFRMGQQENNRTAGGTKLTAVQVWKKS
jgi:16S rRNA G966 N2-methylase RsmD